MARTGWAVAFALGAAAGFCIRGCVSDVPQEREPESRPVDPAPPVERETTRRAPPVSERESNDEPDSGAETRPAPQAPGGGDVREFSLEDGATGFSEIGVEVLDADGAPAADVLVYALLAGAPGEDDEDAVPHARTADDGRCRLLLASPATVDVTALAPFVLARTEDVGVPGTTELRLRLPRAAVARFVVDAERPPGGDVNFSVQRVFRPGMRYLPARGGLQSTQSWGGSIGTARPFAELPLGPVEFEVSQPPAISVVNGVAQQQQPAHPAVFEPKRFVPPATIRVRGPDPSARTLAVELTFDEPKECANRDRSYEYRLEFEDDAVDGQAWCSWEGHQDPRIVLEHPVRSPTGMLRWSGPRLVPGAARWDIANSPKVTGRIEVRPLTAQSAARVFIDMPRDAARDEGRVLLVSRSREYAAETARALIPVGEEVLLDHSGEWVLVDEENDDGPLHRVVAGPVRARIGTLVTLKPRRGGYVVFAPAETPAEGAGEVHIARADGAPFPYAQQGSDYHACRAWIVPGAVLGPFEPGAVTLDVFVGGVRWGRYEVAVREGVWTTFTPRKFR